MNAQLQRGVTLVELIVSIVIVSIAASVLLGVLSIMSRGSADAMIRHQAVAIGNAYLEEALLKDYADRDGSDAETNRADFDDVDDYNGLSDAVARDQFGTALTGLGSYQITMIVVPGTLGALPTAQVKRVDVTVRHASGIAMTFSGYRSSAL